MIDSLRRQRIVPRTVIDVGANVGQFAVAGAKLWAPERLYAFEPIPEVCDRLKRNTTTLPQVQAAPIALGECVGRRAIHVNSYSHSSSILRLSQSHREAFPYARELGTQEIEMATLDSVFAGVEFAAPALLKLDVQGYEANVIKGAAATLPKLRWVIAETSLRPFYEGEALFLDIVALMAESGFRFLRPVGSLCDPRTGEVVQIDAFFEHT